MNETTEDKLSDATDWLLDWLLLLNRRNHDQTLSFTSSHLRMKLPGDGGVQTEPQPATDFLYLWWIKLNEW